MSVGEVTDILEQVKIGRSYLVYSFKPANLTMPVEEKVLLGFSRLLLELLNSNTNQLLLEHLQRVSKMTLYRYEDVTKVRNQN